MSELTPSFPNYIGCKQHTLLCGRSAVALAATVRSYAFAVAIKIGFVDVVLLGPTVVKRWTGSQKIIPPTGRNMACQGLISTSAIAAQSRCTCSQAPRWTGSGLFSAKRSGFRGSQNGLQHVRSCGASSVTCVYEKTAPR